jgi:hypothetical protein
MGWIVPLPPPKIHNVEVLTPGISECDLIWKQDCADVIN